MDEPEMRWARYDGGRVERGASVLRAIQTAPELIVVLPASRVLFHRAPVPPGRAAQSERVLANLVEDAIVSAPEEVHATVIKRLENGDSIIAVVERTWLKQCIGELDLQGFSATRVIAESELLSLARNDEDAWTVVRSAGGGFVHFGDAEALALDGIELSNSTPPLALTLAMEERSARGDGPSRIDVLSQGSKRALPVDRWSHTFGVPVEHVGEWKPEKIDARAAAKTNFFHAEVDRSRSVGNWITRLRAPALLAAAILFVHGLLSAADWTRLSIESRGLSDEMEERFRRVFPDAKIVDPPLQMSRNLADLRRQAGLADASDFVPLLGNVASRLVAAGARTERVRYERGQIQLELNVASGETRESLESKLRAPGLRVQVERVTPQAGGALANVRISAGA